MAREEGETNTQGRHGGHTIHKPRVATPRGSPGGAYLVYIVNPEGKALTGYSCKSCPTRSTIGPSFKLRNLWKGPSFKLRTLSPTSFNLFKVMKRLRTVAPRRDLMEAFQRRGDVSKVGGGPRYPGDSRAVSGVDGAGSRQSVFGGGPSDWSGQVVSEEGRRRLWPGAPPNPGMRRHRVPKPVGLDLTLSRLGPTAPECGVAVLRQDSRGEVHTPQHTTNTKVMRVKKSSTTANL